MGTLGKYARHDVYYKIEAIYGSCRVKNGSLGAVWTACVLPLYSGGPNGAGCAVVRAMELGATVLRTDVSRIIVSGAVLLVAVMVVSGVSIVGTVSRTKVAGDVMSEDWRIGGCCVEGWCCERGAICSVEDCGLEGIVSGAVMVGSIVSVATVARTRVAGAEVSDDYRIDGCGFGGCGSEGGDVGGCGVRLRTDAVGRDGRKDLGHKIVS